MTLTVPHDPDAAGIEACTPSVELWAGSERLPPSQTVEASDLFSRQRALRPKLVPCTDEHKGSDAGRHEGHLGVDEEGTLGTQPQHHSPDLAAPQQAAATSTAVALVADETAATQEGDSPSNPAA